MGAKRAAQQRGATATSTGHRFSLMKKVFTGLQAKLRLHSSAADCLQFPCLEQGNMSSESATLIGYAVLWGDDSALRIVEACLGLDLKRPGISSASITPSAVKVILQEAWLPADLSLASGQEKHVFVREHIFRKGGIMTVSKSLFLQLLILTRFNGEDKPMVAKVSILEADLEGLKILLSSFGLSAKPASCYKETFDQSRNIVKYAQSKTRSKTRKKVSKEGEMSSGEWMIANFDLNLHSTLTFRVSDVVCDSRGQPTSYKFYMKDLQNEFHGNDLDRMMGKIALHRGAVSHAWVACCLVAEVHVLESRLRTLANVSPDPFVSSCQAISLDHLQAASGSLEGLEHGLLEHLRERDSMVLALATGCASWTPDDGDVKASSGFDLAAGLTARLMKVVPTPLSSISPNICSTENTDILKTEIADFVESYIELLAIKGVSVPQLEDGCVPLDVIPSSGQSVCSEAMVGILADPDSTPLRFVRNLEVMYFERVVEGRERLSDIDKRKRHAEEVSAFAAVFMNRSWLGILVEVSGLGFTIWLCFKGCEWWLPFWLSLVGSVAMALWLLNSVSVYIIKALRLKKDAATRDVYSAFGDSLIRSRLGASLLACFRTKVPRLPLAVRVSNLEDDCHYFIDKWRARMAEYNMHECLKRGRISHDQLLLLMEDLSSQAERLGRASQEDRRRKAARIRKRFKVKLGRRRSHARRKDTKSFKQRFHEVFMASGYRKAASETAGRAEDDSMDMGDDEWHAEYEDQGNYCRQDHSVKVFGKMPGTFEDAEKFLALPVGGDMSAEDTIVDSTLLLSAAFEPEIDKAVESTARASIHRMASTLKEAEEEEEEGVGHNYPELRFCVRQPVACFVGPDDHGGNAWTLGTIIKCHFNQDDSYFPYQILKDTGGILFAPCDDDECIRDRQSESWGGNLAVQGQSNPMIDEWVPVTERQRILHQANKFVAARSEAQNGANDSSPRQETSAPSDKEKVDWAETTGKKKPREHQTVLQALQQKGFKFKRKKKHLIFERIITHRDGRTQRQVQTIASSPSDWRFSRNALASIRRIDDGV